MLGDALGKACAASTFRALALAGPADALEIVSIPTRSCALRPFVLTPVLGTAEATKVVALKKAG